MNGKLVNENFDDASEITLDIIKKRAVKGVAALAGRTIFLQLIGLLGTFLLTVFLNPGQFGAFFIVSAAVSFFAYFSDIGLGAAIIQKKERLEKKELETTFTVQTILVVFLVVVIFLATPFFQKWQQLDQESIYLLWALAVSFFLSSLKNIPSLLLERELDFNKFVIPQIVESVFYWGAAVILAWQGFGIRSYTVAVLLRGIAGLIMIYIMRPWKIGIAFDMTSLKRLLRFGIPYQLNTFLAVAKDDGMILILGGILGSVNIGFLGWAQKWATAPLRFFMDAVIKVTFPAFSRMQDNREELARAVSKSVFFICLLVFPALTALVFLAPVLLNIIPKYAKWQPALMALGFICINSGWAAVTTPLTNVLSATGRIKTTFRLMVMWTILTWIFIPPLGFLYGVTGAAAGYALVGSSSIIAILIAVRSIKINLLESVGKPLLASAIMMVIWVLGWQLFPQTWLGVLVLIAIAGISYALSVFMLVGQSIIGDAKKLAFNMKSGVPN